MKQIYSLILFVFVLTACTHEVGLSEPGNNETVRFTASVSERVETRATNDLTLGADTLVTVIAPGYGTGAADQNVKFKASNGVLVPVTENVEIKRSAKNMYYSAWTAPIGVDVEAGTVDFSQRETLDYFIGAHFEEQRSEGGEQVDDIALEFSHLVAKLTVTVKNVALPVEEQLITNATIMFPAIKQIGKITTTLDKHPVVSPGLAGSSLKFTLGGTDNNTFFMPPLTPSELLMYGSFTVLDVATSYVGTLNNLSIEGEKADGIKAGQHITMEIQVKDDHTAVLQAVTLAPWDEYPENLYNRPTPGIWGKEDLVKLSKAFSSGEDLSTYAGYFFDANDPERTIRLYANVSLADIEDFEPIGNEEHPFNLTFDGNGYTISGMTAIGGRNQGLFGVVENATISKVKIRSSYVSGTSYVGTLAGRIMGGTRIDRCEISGGRVLGSLYVGGLTGSVDAGAQVINSYATLSTVSGTTAVGGFVGVNNGMVGNSYCRISTGISASGDAGGFVGRNRSTIENCYSLAYFTRKPTENCGAWVGYNEPGSTNNGCYWNSNCIDNKYCNLVVGNNTAFKDNGLEDYSKLLTGRRFHYENGHLLNDNDDSSTYLRTQLNINREQSDNLSLYQYWAVIFGSSLPVLSNNQLLDL